jgi:hypothetical protein
MRTETLQIDSSESLSDESIRVSKKVGQAQARQTLVAIIMSGTWTAADLTFQASNDGTTFYEMINTSGGNLTVTGPAADEWIAIDPADFVGVEYLKVRSGTVGSAVAQGGNRVLTFVFREVS